MANGQMVKKRELNKDYLLFDEAYDRKQRVTAVNGRVTAYMRKRWGINKVREDGDLHHSVDAVVVACITPGIVQTVTEYAKREENRYLNKDDVAMRERFPMPWPEFSTELDIRTCKEPKEMLRKVSLANYQDVDIDSIKPIFVFNDMFQVRSELYGFMPIFPIKKNALNKAYYGKAFSRFEYLGEISVICQLPFGAISAYVNHYSSPKKEWNVGLTLGWQLFNYRFIE